MLLNLYLTDLNPLFELPIFGRSGYNSRWSWTPRNSRGVAINGTLNGVGKTAR